MATKAHKDQGERLDDAQWLRRHRAMERQLRAARLDRWAGWIKDAKTDERWAVAERIAKEAMQLCGLSDTSVRLDGDPPRDK